ncbi:hypothetical protein PANT_24d00054 [Moesziomyces antarcticus T-34]|uniref:Uncharacterized protein n=1 Tax=Pseudozyma antarctica (strain T-34) TaxID=1151754 RepID=M9M0Q8_PSEA3|nr:hypothetical protein PANT_24d00054 [Moesziomyces antarcticus T-34]
MVATTKFTSLVGSVTLALIVASSLNAAPVLVKRDDAAAPAGYISVAQPQMNEQDIYAVGIPDVPAAAPAAGATFAEVIQAAAQAALAKSNQTMNAVNTYDPTPAPAGAAQSQVAPESNVAAAPNADAVLAGNPDQGQEFQQVIGNLAGAAQVAEGDAGLKGNPDEGDEYRQVIAQQMAQLGQKARRALRNAVWEARQIPPPLASAGAPNTAAPSTASVTDAVTDVPDTVTGVTDTATGVTDAATGVTDTATGVTDTATGVTDATTGASDAVTGATSTTAVTDAAGDVPVAAPVPSDYASPPAPSPSSNAAVPGVPAPAVPGVPSASSVPAAPAVPTSGLPTSGVPSVPTSGVPSVPTSGLLTSALPTGALPTGAVPSAPAVPSASVPALPGLGGGLKDSDAGATTVNASSPSASPTGDLTMTVTLPSTAMPTSLGDLANIKANANANADAINEWKTMTILVPAEAFGGSPSRAASVPAATSTASASSASASGTAASSSSSADDAKVTSTASAIVAVPTDPINLSSFSALKPQATGVLTIPLTGIIDGTTYSTMLTLTIPGVATETAKIPVTTTSDKAPATATAKPSITAAPSKTSSAAESVKTTSSVDPSYIHPDDIPPLLKSSMQATPTSTPNPSSTPTPDGDDEDCEEVDDTDVDVAQPKSLLTKVWDWMSGKPLDERDFEDDYQDADFEEYYDAQE